MTLGLWVETFIPNSDPDIEYIIHVSECLLQEDALILVELSFSVYDQLGSQSSMKAINEEHT